MLWGYALAETTQFHDQIIPKSYTFAYALGYAVHIYIYMYFRKHDLQTLLNEFPMLLGYAVHIYMYFQTQIASYAVGYAVHIYIYINILLS